MVTAQQIKQKIDEAKANPNSVVATELRKRLDSGAYDSQLGEIGLSRTPQGLKPIQQDSFRQDLRETGQSIKNSIQERLGNIDTIRGAMQSGEQGNVRSVLQTAGQVAGGISDIAGEAFIGAGKAVLPQKAEDAIGGAVQTGVQAVTQNPAFETSAVGTLMSKYNTLKETNPKVARDIDALLGIGALGLDVAIPGVGGNVTKKGATALKKGIKETGDGLSDVLKSNIDNLTNTTTDTPIFSSIDDALKDTASGRTLDNTSKIRQGAGGQEGLLTTAEKKKLLEIAPEKGNKYIEALKQSEADLDAPTIFSILEDDASKAVSAYKEATNKIGSDIGDIKKALQSKKVTLKDTNEIINDIRTKLAEKRVLFKNGQFVLGKQSPFTQADVSALNEQILDTLNNVKSARSMDDLLLGMERLDNIINFNKASDLTGSLQGVSKNVRAKLKGIRDKALTPEQAKRFDDYSQAQTFADEFLKNENKVSTLLNRLGAKNSRKSMEFVKEIERVTGENIGDSARLVEILTSATGTTSRNRSLLQKYMGDVASDVTSLSPTGILGSTVNAGVKSLLKVDKLNEIQKAINTVINLPK